VVLPPLPPPLPVAPPEPPVIELEPPDPLPPDPELEPPDPLPPEPELEPPDPEAVAPPEPELLAPPEPEQPSNRGNTAVIMAARQRILIYGVTCEGRFAEERAATYCAKHSFIISDHTRSPTWFPPD
jgi:hypothetical protein